MCALVPGVQTCALLISRVAPRKSAVREQEVRRRHVEVVVDEEGGDRCGELVARLARLKARAAGVGRRGGAFVGGAAACVAKPQPTQEPSYRLVRCCRFGGHATFNERARPDLSLVCTVDRKSTRLDS